MPNPKPSSTMPWRWLLSALLPMLGACSAPALPGSAATPLQLPAMPAVLTAQPSQPYSTSAKQRIESWQQRLTATPPTP